MEKKINITNDDVLIIPIAYNGEDTGEYLEFDVEDIDLPFRYQEMLEKDRKNKEWLRNKSLIIEKKEDVQKNDLMTTKQEELIKVTKEFFEKEVEIYNMFLGENGVQKLLHGRKLGWLTLSKIDDIIEQNILPYLDLSFKGLQQKIKDKYQETKDKNVI